MDKKFFQPTGIIARRLRWGSMLLYQSKWNGVIYYRRRKSSKTTQHAKVKTTDNGQRWTVSN